VVTGEKNSPTVVPWGLEHRASNPVSVKNLTAIETSTIVKSLRPYVPVGTKRTSNFRLISSLQVYRSKFCTQFSSLP
jgi:hypothetical protein